MHANLSIPRPVVTSGPVRQWHALVLFVLLINTSLGHDLFTAYIQHRVAITVGARYLDVIIQLNFFEDGSEHERGHMDTDGDGRLSRAETERYLADIETSTARAVALRLDGKPLELIPLYAPQLDLLGNDRVGRGHHRLTLHFFATTPDDLVAGMELTIEDRLWSGVRALGALQVEGCDGARLEAVPSRDPIHPPARDGRSRAFQARLLEPPALAVANPNLPSDPLP